MMNYYRGSPHPGTGDPALRRVGAEIDPASDVRTDLEPRDGTVPRLTRRKAAEEAGLSERRRRTTLRIANIPEDEFEAAIEQENPATVAALSALGTQQRQPDTANLKYGRRARTISQHADRPRSRSGPATASTRTRRDRPGGALMPSAAVR